MRDEVDPLANHDPSLTAAPRESWRRAWQLERAMSSALGSHGDFRAWLLLESLHELVRETGDAVSQAQLVERTGLSSRVISYQMSWLSEHGFVDRGPALDGRSYRIYLSADGELTLLAYADRLRAAGLVVSEEDARPGDPMGSAIFAKVAPLR